MDTTIIYMMSRSIQSGYFVLSAICLVALAGGCSGLSAGGERASGVNSISVHKIVPQQPAVLPLGERLMIKIAYERETTNDTVIFARPFIDGRQAVGAKVHPPSACLKMRGRVDGWVSFQKKAWIDEIRITMLDNISRVVLKSTSHPVDVSWTE